MSTLELPALYVDSVALVVSTPRLVVVNRDPSPGETGVPVDAMLALELIDMRTHFLFEGDFRDSDQLFCGDRASLKKRDRIPGSGNANAFLRNCWPPSPWTVVKARSHDGSAAWP